MYSDKYTVNALTALLVAKGVRHAVLCPGSRNIPLVADFCEVEQVECHAVTDERSAAFYALGIALAVKQPVVLCLTSGSALLNAAPAVCEAFYRHVPLIVLSADRPKAWIDRIDGQTIRQAGALANFVRAQADIDDAAESDAATCSMQALQLNNTINRALEGEGGPVHINVHISEPFFSFTTPQLPTVRNIAPLSSADMLGEEELSVARRFMAAANRMIVIGQLPFADKETDMLVRQLKRHCLVVCECLSSASSDPSDRIMAAFMRDDKVTPIDVLISMGGNFVGKNIKKFLRSRTVKEHWEVNADGVAHDTFGAQTGIVRARAKTFLRALLHCCEEVQPSCPLMEKWNEARELTQRAIDTYEPHFSQLMAVRELENSLEDMDYDSHVHYANSMAVRVGSLYAGHYVWCNRGVNGIEGSISTAAGFSLATTDKVFCVTGDLSFFYDQNALWNTALRGNLRILLVNNSCGGIFSQLSGLNLPSETMRFVAGQHTACARGICEQNDIGYLKAGNAEELHRAMALFMTEETKRPVVLEVFTNADDDRTEFAALVKKQINGIK